MSKEVTNVRVVFLTTPETQHLLRQLAAKRNQTIKDTMQELIASAAKAEGLVKESEARE